MQNENKNWSLFSKHRTFKRRCGGGPYSRDIRGTMDSLNKFERTYFTWGFVSFGLHNFLCYDRAVSQWWFTTQFTLIFLGICIILWAQLNNLQKKRHSYNSLPLFRYLNVQYKTLLLYGWEAGTWPAWVYFFFWEVRSLRNVTNC